MCENKEALTIIKTVANQILQGCRILLFGSRVRNETRKYSDYDVMLIVPENITTQEKMRKKALFRKMIVQYGILTDVFIESEEDIQEKSILLGHIVRTAVREGVYI